MEIDKVQREIQDLKDALQQETESKRRQTLKEAIRDQEKILMDLQEKLKPEELRRSTREPAPTEKMILLQKEMANKKVKTLLSSYEQWKVIVRSTRSRLKSKIPESEVSPLIDELVKMKETVLNLYLEIRDHVAPETDVRRKVDACESISKDLLKILYELSCLIRYKIDIL